MSDSDILGGLRDEDGDAFEKLYIKCRPKCVSFAISKLYRKSLGGISRACSEDEALDLYHDAFIIFFENVRAGRLVKLSASPCTYISTTMKYNWLTQLRKEHFSSEKLPELMYEETDNNSEIQGKVRKALEQLSSQCLSMLTLRYFMGWDYEDIATTLEYNNGDVVRNLISRCRREFRGIFNDLS